MIGNAIAQGFPYTGGIGRSSSTSQKFTNFSHQEKDSPVQTFISPSSKVHTQLNNNFHVITHKTSFLVVVIAVLPFLF